MGQLSIATATEAFKVGSLLRSLFEKEILHI